jgi:hypothetical protein
MQMQMKVKWKVVLWLCCALLCAGSTPTLSGALAKPYSPKPGSAERKAILDALRVPVQKRAKQQIVFYNVEMRVENGWAWVLAISKDKTGKKMPLGDLMTCGLLRKTNGRWRVLHWGIAGDISVACEAHKKYPKSPRAIYGGIDFSAC